MTVIVETRADLTLETARRVAWEGEGVELGARALAAMAQGRDRLEHILEHDPEVTIYGVTTGPGQLARTKLTPEQREHWAGMSPAGAAASWGDPLSFEAAPRLTTRSCRRRHDTGPSPWRPAAPPGCLPAKAWLTSSIA